MSCSCTNLLGENGQTERSGGGQIANLLFYLSAWTLWHACSQSAWWITQTMHLENTCSLPWHGPLCSEFVHLFALLQHKCMGFYFDFTSFISERFVRGCLMDSINNVLFLALMYWRAFRSRMWRCVHPSVNDGVTWIFLMVHWQSWNSPWTSNRYHCSSLPHETIAECLSQVNKMHEKPRATDEPFNTNELKMIF